MIPAGSAGNVPGSTGTPVTAIDGDGPGHWCVHTGTGDTLTAEEVVVLATDAAAAPRILGASPGATAGDKRLAAVAAEPRTGVPYAVARYRRYGASCPRGCGCWGWRRLRGRRCGTCAGVFGIAPARRLFEVLAGPLLQPCTPGIMFGGYRTVSFDGCKSIKVPDTARNRAWLASRMPATGDRLSRRA